MELNTYLGQKGYTIQKNEISIEKQKIAKEPINDYKVKDPDEMEDVVISYKGI